MKQVSITLYEFSELNEEAKKRAINDARGWVVEGETDIIGDSFWFTIEKIEEVFGIKVEEDQNGMLGWEWNEDHKDRFEYANWQSGNEVQDDPKMLVRYLNEVAGRINTLKKYYLPLDKWVKGRRHITAPSRESKVMSKGYDHCLTGDYSDKAVDDMMNGRWVYVRDGATIWEFLTDLMVNLKVNWDDELEEMTSDDAIADLLGDTFRGYMYTKEGQEINVEG